MAVGETGILRGICPNAQRTHATLPTHTVLHAISEATHRCRRNQKDDDTLGLWPRHTDAKATRAHVCLRNTTVVVPRSSFPPAAAASTPIAFLISLASLYNPSTTLITQLLVTSSIATSAVS